VIKESLRITTLVVSRLPLVAPCDALRYKQWLIPPGTPVSMSLRDILLDESIYERPLEFLPERWLAVDGNHSRRARFHLPFGRGSRMCIGLNLAMAELYLVLGSMFRRFDIDLYHMTRERDIDVVRDCFVGEPCRDSVGVRVKVSPVR
jgi:cytochrome P450